VWCRQFPAFVEELEGLLTENRIFKQRTVDIGVMTPEQAMEWGFSGPNLRASGLRLGPAQGAALRDLPRAGFRHPGRPHGDCYDRYLVRVREMMQSLRIVEQCLERLEPGPVRIRDFKIAPPPRRDMKRSMEALIHHFKLYTEGFHVPAARPTP
jgi:NADH-quinone oxidoreductase subunit D